MRRFTIFLAVTAAALSLAGAASAEPTLLGLPSISGDTTAVGNSLTANPAAWDAGTVSLQWLRCTTVSCTSIGGATGRTYTITAADVGSWLALRSTDSVGGGAVFIDVAAPVPAGGAGDGGAPSHPLTPRFEGDIDASVGDTISARDLGWEGAQPMTISYQWFQCVGSPGCTPVPIAGQTGPTYTTDVSDIGTIFGVTVTATNVHGSSQYTLMLAQPFGTPHLALESDPVGFQRNSTWNFTPGSLVTAETGTWAPSDTAVAVEWDRCTDAAGSSCSKIGSASGFSYEPTSADVGFYLALIVTGTTDAGVQVWTAVATVPVAATHGAPAGPLPPVTSSPGGTLPEPPPLAAVSTTQPVSSPTASLQPVSPPATPPAAQSASTVHGGATADAANAKPKSKPKAKAKKKTSRPKRHR